MSRIVLASFGSYGDLYPYLGLGCALQQRGHDVTLAMPAVYQPHAARAGLGFHAVRPDLDPEDRVLIARIMDAARGSEVLVKELLIPHLADSYRDLLDASAGADLLVTHPGTLAGPLVAEQRGLTWASSVLAPLSFFSAFDPVVPPPAPWVYALTSRSRPLSRLFLRLSDAMTRRWTVPVAELRRTLGLSSGGNPLMGGQHSPHLVLALFSRCLGRPQPDWPANVEVTGPIFYDDPEHDLLPPVLEAFLASGPPPIVFTLGTSAVEAAGAFYETSAGVAERLGQRAVLLVGRVPANRPHRLGRGVLSVEFASHARLFARASVIVHQGGVGTLQQALAAGRPMLVVPHAHDQADNARRAVSLGVARRVYPRQYRPRRLARELTALLEGAAYAGRARQVAADLETERGPTAACDAIERLLAGPSQRSRAQPLSASPAGRESA